VGKIASTTDVDIGGRMLSSCCGAWELIYTRTVPPLPNLNELTGMKSGSMKPELKQWLVARQNILKQMD
jgi:hypothetical protein